MSGVEFIDLSVHKKSSNRKRGVVLSPYGVTRLRQAIGQAETTENQGKPYLTEELSQRTGVSKSTLSRLWSAKSAVDLRSLRLIFSAFGLEINELDLKNSEDDSQNPMDSLTSVLTPVSINPLPYPSGPVPLNSPFYVLRPPLEERACLEVKEQGCVIRIKSPSGFGKSSLILRILAYAKELEYKIVTLNLKQTDLSILEDSGRFLRWFCSAVALKLGKQVNLEDHWSEFLGDSLNCTVFMREQILAPTHSPILLCIEELNTLFAHSKTAQAFFPLLRSWQEEARHDPVWQQLRLVVSYSTESYLPLDINKSPFSSGLPIFLPEFTLEQVQDLVQRHQLQLSISELHQLMNLIGGHPLLIRIALYHLSQENLSLKTLCDIAPQSNGIFHNYLQNLLVELPKNPPSIESLKALVMSDRPVILDPFLAYQLEAKGLIKMTSDGWIIRLNLYRSCLQNWLA